MMCVSTALLPGYLGLLPHKPHTHSMLHLRCCTQPPDTHLMHTHQKTCPVAHAAMQTLLLL